MALSALIDKKGTPTPIELLQPTGFGLDERDVGAFQEWRFEPTNRDGRVVEVRIEVEFNFGTL